MFTMIIKLYDFIMLASTNIISMTNCYIRGIEIGTGANYWGFSKFVKSPGSTMKFGYGCRFRSKSSSNLIGINHLCMFSTHSKNARLEIGNNCGFSGTTIGCFKEIVIGDNVLCGANTLITDSDWHPNDQRSSPPKAVKIERNVWLGYGAIVLKGVTIGENSIIGAGSVVIKDIPANVIAAGNPCKTIRPIDS